MESSTRKQYLELEDKPVLIRSIQLFLDHRKVEQVVVVIPPGDRESVGAMLEEYCPGRTVTLTEGGKSRQESISRGLQVVLENAGLVCIHDAARPLASGGLLENLLEEAALHGAAVPVIPLSDTVKEVGPGGFVLKTPPRDSLRRVQTPQVFLKEVIAEAYGRALENGWPATDDASLVEMIGRPVKTVAGETNNLKITSPHDLMLASIILRGAEH